MTAPLHRIRNYEDLDGAQGREVFFRPHRYRASDLAPLHSTVTVTVGNQTHPCTLVDVSQSGVAFEWPATLPVAVGDRIPRLALSFDDQPLYQGEARVGSVRKNDPLTVVGVSFEGPLLPTDDVLDLRLIRAFTDRGGLSSNQPWRVEGHQLFKARVCELRLYLEDAEKQLARLETELPWHAVHGEGSAARAALVRSLMPTFVADVVGFTEAIDAAVRSASPKDSQALTQWSRRQIHDVLMRSPPLHRSFHKPFGYAGDYEVMRFIYEKPFEGADLFSKALSLAFGHTTASRAVRSRKDLVKSKMADMIRGGRPARVLAVACGPAQELFELLQEANEIPSLEVVLFDQDKGALSYAYRRTAPLIEARQGRVKVTYLHDSIKRLLRDAELFTDFGSFDLIYSVGLFDYLKTPTAVALTRNLVSLLAPGGQAMLANMVPNSPSRWYMEHHLDWWLTYRTRSEILDFAGRAGPHTKLRIVEEETGVNPFVEMTRE